MKQYILVMRGDMTVASYGSVESAYPQCEHIRFLETALNSNLTDWTVPLLSDCYEGMELKLVRGSDSTAAGYVRLNGIPAACALFFWGTDCWAEIVMGESWELALKEQIPGLEGRFAKYLAQYPLRPLSMNYVSADERLTEDHIRHAGHWLGLLGHAYFRECRRTWLVKLDRDCMS